jgi:hypothetical protein
MCAQVSIVDGQIVVDAATLTVQAQAEDTQRTVVEDTQQLNSRSYAVNRTPSDRWQAEETENFFNVRGAADRRVGQRQQVLWVVCIVDSL